MTKLIQRIAVGAVCLWLLPGHIFGADLLIPVGQVVGLQLSQDAVTVAAFDDTLGVRSKKAGLKIGDEIVTIDGQRIQCARDVHAALEQSDGTVEIEVNRKGKNKQLKITPEITSQGPRLGVFLRDGVTGIGTVTWYDPDSGKFGTLGHGVNNARGELMEMRRGQAFPAEIVAIKKGEPGEPGQLRGAVTSEIPKGTLYRNTAQGVFGTANGGWQGEPLPIGEAEDVHTGKATIRATVSGNQVQEYSVEIMKIYSNSRKDGRNLMLRVTDPALLSATGGIVQGMGVSYNKDNQWNP